MSDLRCSDCGIETTYGDAQITELETSCEHERTHNFEKINEYGQITGDAWRNEKDTDLWATHEVRCTECNFIWCEAYGGGKVKTLREFGAVSELCPKCKKTVPVIDSKYWDESEMRNDKFNE